MCASEDIYICHNRDAKHIDSGRYLIDLKLAVQSIKKEKKKTLCAIERQVHEAHKMIFLSNINTKKKVC